MERGRTVLPKKNSGVTGTSLRKQFQQSLCVLRTSELVRPPTPPSEKMGEQGISSAGFSSTGKLAARRIAGGSRRLRAALTASSDKKNVPFRDFLISFQPVPPSDCLPIFRSFLPFSAMPERPGSLPRYRPRLRRSPPCTRDPRYPGVDPKNPAVCKFCVPDPLR